MNMITATVRYNDNCADIDFPCSDIYLYSKLMELHADDPNNTTLFVSEIVEPEELSCLKDRFVNLDELNYLAKRMDSFFGDEEIQFYEALKLEHFTELKDFINLSFNLDKYTLIRDVSNMGKVGREYLLNRDGCVPAHDEDDPKYAVIGRELLQSGTGVFTEHGLLFPDRSRPFEEPYNGKTFPPYLYDQRLLMGEMEYEGSTEYVYLPDSDMAIDKALKRLGAESPDSCSIILSDFSTDHKKMFDLFKSVLGSEGIYEVNHLARAVNEFADIQSLQKLSAVMEYADVSDAKSIAALAENLGAFGYAKEVEDYEDLGRWWIENHDELQLSMELEDYFDYDQYGEEIHRGHSGEFLADGGYVYMECGHSLEDIIDTDEEESMAMGGM